MSQLIEVGADLGALHEWIRTVDERERVSALIGDERLTTGSTGQQRLNPLISYRQQLAREIRQAEEAFGMTPLARMRLGFEFTAAGDAFARMKAHLDELAPLTDFIPTEYAEDE